MGYIYMPTFLTQAVAPSYTYPFDLQNGAAGFSTSRLRSAYAGSCLRVRRSSDNAEQDIGFSGVSLDTASLLSFCGAGNGFVYKWYDQSGNGYDYSNATGANQPQLVSGGSVLTSLNGQPILRFTGSPIALVMSVAASNMLTTSEGTVFTAFNATTITSNSGSPFVNHHLWGDDGGYVGHALKLGATLQAWADVGGVPHADQAVSVATNYVGVWRHTGGNILTYLNSSTPGATTVCGTGGSLGGSLRVGLGYATGTGYYLGDIGAVLFYKVSTTTNFTAIGQALAARYGLTWT